MLTGWAVFQFGKGCLGPLFQFEGISDMLEQTMSPTCWGCTPDNCLSTILTLCPPNHANLAYTHQKQFNQGQLHLYLFKPTEYHVVQHVQHSMLPSSFTSWFLTSCWTPTPAFIYLSQGWRWSSHHNWPKINHNTFVIVKLSKTKSYLRILVIVEFVAIM